MTDPLNCGRHTGVVRSMVCDPEKLLSSDAQDEVEGHINAITEKTGAQVATIIISKMDSAYGKPGESKERTAERFSVDVHQRWGVGSATKNDGVLIFLAVSDRVLFISTGAGVQDLISERIIQGIIDNMRPHLKKKRYDVALIDCVITIGQLLAGDENPSFAHYKRSSTNKTTDWITLLGFVGFLALTVYLGIRQSRQLRNYERGRRALDTLMHEVENTAEGNRYFTSSCPICLEDLRTEKEEGGKDDRGAVSSAFEDGGKNHNSSSIRSDAVSSGDNENRVDCMETAAAMKKDDDLYAEESSTAAREGVEPISSATEASAANAAKKAPMALRCGHTFCSDCLSTYLRSSEGTRCPICRHPVHDDFTPPPAGPDDSNMRRRPATDAPPGGGAGSSSCASTMSADAHAPDMVRSDDLPIASAASSRTSEAFVRRAPEIRYRLGRIRHLYPDVMTAELLRSMNSAVDRGSLVDFRTGIEMRSREVQQRVTEIRRASADAARRSGRSGHSGGSFGGGRSSGGGGGSW